MTHNSYGYMDNAGANQMCSVNSQLADGVRGLKLSAVRPANASSTDPNAIRLCHTDCRILDAGPAKDTLASIATWLKNNPNEVLTIMWNNMGKFKAADFQAAYEGSGILDYTYTQAVGSQTWPTLQEMIASGKRVVNFLDSGADQTTVPWLMSEFNYVFETPYNNMNESSFSCVIDRPSDPAQPEQMMYVMNHFLYRSISSLGIAVELPQKDLANVTNADSLLKQAKTCTTTFGRQPNFLEVDFYNKGNSLAIAAQLNNVTFKPSGQQCVNDQATTAKKPDSSATTVAFSPLIALLAVFMAALSI
ncbi:hypothetical protein EC973_002212 [Apophysomyces ossiformis]|uniref:PLC-like phosphodiesterase n=1 Tax=Apophysomyces ossiformis TaxID=679940 RepID=A0A8H7BTZ8_9FUNG|nr:hypothetical protein EC973_002212 [Apophysomyces ossiformis]